MKDDTLRKLKILAESAKYDVLLFERYGEA